MPSQALVKPSGNSFLAILASASEEQAPGSWTMEADADSNADTSGAEGNSSEQTDAAVPARTLPGDGSEVNQLIAQKSDLKLQSAGAKEQTTGTSTGKYSPTRTSLRNETSSESKAVSSSAAQALDASALTAVQTPATMSSFQGALACLSAAQTGEDAQTGVDSKAQPATAANIAASGGAASSTASSMAVNGNASENAVVSASPTRSAINSIQPLFASVRDAGTLSSDLTAASAITRSNSASPSNSSAVNDASAQPLSSTRTNMSGDSMLSAPTTAAASSATPLEKLTNAIANGQQNQASVVFSPVITRPGSNSTPDTQAGSTPVTSTQSFVPAQLIARAVPDIQAPEAAAGSAKRSAAGDPVPASSGNTADATTANQSPNATGNAAATIAGQAVLQPLALAVAPVLPTIGGSNQTLSNGTAKATPNAPATKSTAAASSAGAGSSNAADNSNGPVDGSSHGAQSNGQTAQDAQADPSQTAGAVAKTGDNGAAHAQVQIPVAAAATPAASSAHRTQDGSDASSGLGEQAGTGTVHAESGETVATSSINTAKLMQTMSESEMRVGMRSSEFGEISIRTSVSQQQMVAQISLDHSDLSQAIAAHVSTVQAKLGDDYGIRASIEVHNLGSSLANGSGQPSQREQRDFVRSTRPEVGLPAVEDSSNVHLAAAASVSNGNRLDIRA